jgi:hypothetical protein
MWICVSVCEYLVIWSDETTVHEIIDCSSTLVRLSEEKRSFGEISVRFPLTINFPQDSHPNKPLFHNR